MKERIKRHSDVSWRAGWLAKFSRCYAPRR